MVRKVLKNKPLVEAIFELRWELRDVGPGLKSDPQYKILVGRMYDRVKEEYPFHEQLPSAQVPDEFVGHTVQHRFRKDENDWPLIQVGPGIATLNDTAGYTWDGFEAGISDLLQVLFEAYPDAESNFKVSELLLRYIDALDFDYEAGDVLVFLKEKMKTEIGLYEELFEESGVGQSPSHLDLRLGFPSTRPQGALNLRFVRGKREGKDALVWETMVRSVGDDIPKARDQILLWARQAHDLTSDWFFKTIEGELKRRFE